MRLTESEDGREDLHFRPGTKSEEAHKYNSFRIKYSQNPTTRCMNNVRNQGREEMEYKRRRSVVQRRKEMRDHGYRGSMEETTITLNKKMGAHKVTKWYGWVNNGEYKQKRTNVKQLGKQVNKNAGGMQSW